MSNPITPQLRISLDFAERLVRQLHEAAKETGRESLLRDAEGLQAEIDVQFSQSPPRH
jgi:hypothetical protein